MTEMTPEEQAADNKARNRRVPELWQVWVMCKANAAALLLVVIAFIGVGYIVIHGEQEARKQRRREFCQGIHETLEGALVDSLAVAFRVSSDSPEAGAFRTNIKVSLGPDCTGPSGTGATPSMTIPPRTSTTVPEASDD